MLNFLKDFGLPAYVVGALTLVAFIYKHLKDRQEQRLATTKEQLDTLTEVLTDKEKSSQPFIVEQAFSYRFGTYVPYTVIALLLKVEDPTDAISNFIRCKRYLEVDEARGLLTFKGRLKGSTYRTLRERFGVAAYFGLVILAGSIIMVLRDVILGLGPIWGVTTGLVVFYILFLAYEALDGAAKLRTAAELVETIAD